MTLQTGERLHRSPDVRSAGDGDLLVLLDLRSGKYFSFSSTAALIWRQLDAGLTPAEVAASLQGRYGIPQARADDDVAALVERFVRSGFILRQVPTTAQTADPEVPPAADPPPREWVDELFAIPDDLRWRAGGAVDFARALAVLVVVDLLMKLGGLGRIHRLIASRRPRRRRRSPQPAAPIDVWATIRAVDRAASLYFKKIWCLQSSAACTYLLRLQNVAAELVLGVLPAPFEAHAWVEIGGRAVHEGAPGKLKALTEIDRW